MKKQIAAAMGIFFLAASFISASKPVFAGQNNIYPVLTDDTYVNSSDPDGNMGTVGNYPFGYFNQETYMVYLKWEAFNIPSNATINSAYLGLYKDSCVGAPSPNTFTIAQVAANWSEGTINWSNRPNATTQVSASANCGLSNTFTYYDIKTIAQNWKSGGPSFGLVLYGPKNGNWYRAWWAKESGHAARLSVDYTTPDNAPPAGGGGSGNTNPAPPGGGSTGTTPSTGASAAPIDTNVAPPTLYQVYSNGKAITLDGSTADISFGRYASVLGTGTAGNKILAFVNGTTYETTVNSLGYWGVNLDTEGWKEGKYEFKAQQVNSAGKGSSVASLVNLEKIDLEKLARELAAGNKGLGLFDRLGIFGFFLGPLFTLLFWVFIILLIILLVHRHRKKKKAQLAAQSAPVAAPAQPAPPLEQTPPVQESVPQSPPENPKEKPKKAK